jgi:hypothetical protein
VFGLIRARSTLKDPSIDKPKQQKRLKVRLRRAA